MRWQGFHALVYVDDFVGCEASFACMHQAFDYLWAICGHLDLRLTPDKCGVTVPHLIWLGFEVCVERMKLRLVLEECDRWLSRSTMTRKALQSLISCLAYIANCIPTIQRFMSRGLRRSSPTKIDPENHKGR